MITEKRHITNKMWWRTGWQLVQRPVEAIVVPTPQRTKATSDQELEYATHLRPMDVYHITLRTNTIRAEHIKRMRVRAGKAGPNGKPRTELNMLAKAEPTYAFGKVEQLITNDGFGKYNEIKVNEKQHDPKHKHIYKRINGYSWEYVDHVNVVKQLTKSTTVAFVNESVLQATNRLLRQILLFKGIGFAQIEQDLRVAGKPVTYLLNTSIEYNTRRKNAQGGDIIWVFKAHKVTVKKTFRELENVMGQQQERCKVFFQGHHNTDGIKTLTLWLKSLKGLTTL